MPHRLCEHYASNVRVCPIGAGLDLYGLRQDGTEFPIKISLSSIQSRAPVPSNSSRDGYGLGPLLALKLDVRSESGRGSSFSLVLPASGHDAALPMHASKRHASAGLQIGAPDILLVEDDPAVRRATRMLLKVEGYRVTAVASLAEALQHGSSTRSGAPLLMTGDTSAAIAELPCDPYLRVASKTQRCR